MDRTQIPLQDLNEEVAIESLPISGKLPAWLEGTLIRNGPAKFHFGTQTINHWFDGLGMLHAFTFGQGKVSYRNKFLRSDAYTQCVEHGNLRFMGFAQDPCKSIFKRLFSYFIPSLSPLIVQNANVNVMRFAENYVALTETPLPVRFDPETLETLGVLNFQDNLSKKDCFESAHPHYDRRRSIAINYQIEFGAKCHYSIYAIPDKGPAVRTPFFKMATDKASYMHTFAITERYVIMVEFPLLLNPLDLLLKGGGFITQFKWEPERNTRFLVIDREQGSLVKTFETESFFCFHHVNAYEENDTLVVDLIKYPDAAIVYGAPPKGQKRFLTRFRLNLTANSIEESALAETLLELPRIHYQKHNMAYYKYVYGVGFKYPEHPSDSIPLLKIDVSTGNQLEWKEIGSLAGEPIFIPHPNALDEDDGILLSLVINELKNHSFLLILDAKNFNEIGRAEGLHSIPYGLHGLFIKGKI